MYNPQSFDLLSAGGSQVHLRLIETTDLHLHLLSWDYYADRAVTGIGLEAAAGVIEAARREVPNALLFDNGDFLQGTPMGDFLAQDSGLPEGARHPAIAAMAELGYDAITLGNHEFNYGMEFLERVLSGADFPVVSANLARRLGASPCEDAHFVPPFAILEREVNDQSGELHKLKIGVIGFAPPQVIDWDRHHLAGRLEGRDMLEAARAWVPQMRAAGADIVVALAHTGIGAARHVPGMENAAVPLARSGGFDALLTGHSHLLFPSPIFNGFPDVDPAAGTIAGIPAVMGGWRGAHVGVIDLLLAQDRGVWQVVGSRSEVRPVDSGRKAVQPAEQGLRQRVSAAVQEAHERTVSAFRQPAGECQAPLHSYFTHLGRIDSLALVARAKIAHVEGRLADPGLAALPILGSVAPFKSGGLAGPHGYTDVPAGELVHRHLADLYAFPNALAAVRITGRELLEWLERSGSAYNRIAPGSSETQLRNPGVAGYQFEVIEPVEVIYDLTQPARYDIFGHLADPGARRVVSAKHDGEPIAPDAEFILCTNSFRLNGAANFLDPDRSGVVLNDGTIVRDALRQFVARCGAEARAGGSLGFAPIPGTTALFETGPGARPHLAEIAGYAPVMRGRTRSGFLRMKIDLSGAAQKA